MSRRKGWNRASKTPNTMLLKRFTTSSTKHPFQKRKKGRAKGEYWGKRNGTKFRFHDLTEAFLFFFFFFTSHVSATRGPSRCDAPTCSRVKVVSVVRPLSHSCRIVHAEASERASERTRARVSTSNPVTVAAARRAARLHEQAQPRASSAGFGCIPRASTRETALERSAECNAQYRANTRRRDAPRCEQLRPDPSPSARDYANFSPLCSFPFFIVASLSFSFFLLF